MHLKGSLWILLTVELNRLHLASVPTTCIMVIMLRSEYTYLLPGGFCRVWGSVGPTNAIHSQQLHWHHYELNIELMSRMYHFHHEEDKHWHPLLIVHLRHSWRVEDIVPILPLVQSIRLMPYLVGQSLLHWQELKNFCASPARVAT